MFNSISGTITAKNPASIYIETNGVEWEIATTSFSLDSFGPLGSKARAFVWLYHREDQMRLFGFYSVRERDLFLDLMRVDGVGAKQALKILSSISPLDLESALDSGDVDRICAAPGIGTKTAQKMVLALKGKLTYASQGARANQSAVAPEFADVVRALTDMGFDRKAVEPAVEAIAAELRSAGSKGTADFEKDLFHRAIVALSS